MTTMKLADASALASGAAPFTPTTLEELVSYCARLQPKFAAEREDSTLCVTPLITRLVVDGRETSLKLVDGKWGAGYTRVSQVLQRSAKSVLGAVSEARLDAFIGTDTPIEELGGDVSPHEANDDASPDESDAAILDPDNSDDPKVQSTARRKHRKPKLVPDGYSEEEQLARQIRYFVSKGWAFRIYSDCGMAGEYPINQPSLIAELLEGRARRYEKIYRRTMLDETSRLRRTPEQIAAMEAYLAKTVARIRRAAWTVEQIDASDDLCQRSKRRFRSSKRRRVFFRQALTQLWRDIEASHVHTLAVSDRSRLCRAADLESAFLRMMERNGTRLEGLIEDLSSLDVSDPLKKGITYFLAGVNEYRLEELAGHVFRGTLQLLESGHPNARLPWWLERDDAGHAVIIPGRDDLVRRIVDMSLAGMGHGAITTQLHAEGIRIDGKPLTRAQIMYLVDGKAIAGIQEFFGLDWPVYPRIVTDETVQELRERAAEKSAHMTNLHDTSMWADHLFTGLCRCWCGSPLIFMHADNYRKSLGCTGTYHCKTAHKSHNPADPAHAYVAEEKLEAFLAEVIRDNPRVLRNAIDASGERRAKVALRLSLLDEQFRVAQADYDAQYKKARAEAEDDAIKLMKMRPDSPGFESVVNGRTESLMEEHAARLATLKQERLLIRDESLRDRENARALGAVDELAAWDNLDARTKNRLLRTVIASITVYPLGHSKRVGMGGYLEIKTVSGQVLAPIRLRRGPRRGIHLPTVAEWIASVFECGAAEGSIVPVAVPQESIHSNHSKHEQP